MYTDFFYQDLLPVFHRIVKAITISAFGQISTILIQLVSVPLLIGNWGTLYYGEWLLLMTIPSYLGLSDGGMVSALTNELAISIAREDVSKAIRQLSNGLFLVSMISLLCACLFAIGVAFWPYQHVLNIYRLTASDALTTVGWLISYGLMSVQMELLSGVYQASHRYALGRAWINVTRIVEFSAMIGVVLLSGKAPEVAVAYFIIRCCALLLMWLDSRRRFNWVGQLSPRYISGTLIRSLLSPSASFLAFAIGNAIMLQGSLVLIGALLSPVQVVIYNTLRTLTNALRQLIGIINSSFWPELTVAVTQRRLKTAAHLHRFAIQTAFWFCLLGGITLELVGKSLLAVWTNNRIAMEQPLFTLLIISSLTYSIWNTSAITTIATNRHQSIAIRYLLGSCIAVGLGFITLPYKGLPGFVLGFIVIDLTLILFVFRRSVALLEVERMGLLVKSVFTDFRWMKRINSLRQL